MESGENADLHIPRVLIVDDEDAVRAELLDMFLDEGVDALDRIRRRHKKLVHRHVVSLLVVYVVAPAVIRFAHQKLRQTLKLVEAGVQIDLG